QSPFTKTGVVPPNRCRRWPAKRMARLDRTGEPARRFYREEAAHDGLYLGHARCPATRAKKIRRRRLMPDSWPGRWGRSPDFVANAAGTRRPSRRNTSVRLPVLPGPLRSRLGIYLKRVRRSAPPAREAWNTAGPPRAWDGVGKGFLPCS